MPRVLGERGFRPFLAAQGTRKRLSTNPGRTVHNQKDPETIATVMRIFRRLPASQRKTPTMAARNIARVLSFESDRIGDATVLKILQANAGRKLPKATGQGGARKPLNPKVLERMRALRKKGWSHQRIADKLKISVHTVGKKVSYETR